MQPTRRDGSHVQRYVDATNTHASVLMLCVQWLASWLREGADTIPIICKTWAQKIQSTLF